MENAHKHQLNKYLTLDVLLGIGTNKSAFSVLTISSSIVTKFASQSQTNALLLIKLELALLAIVDTTSTTENAP
jgi:hypothetical protein